MIFAGFAILGAVFLLVVLLPLSRQPTSQALIDGEISGDNADRILEAKAIYDRRLGELADEHQMGLLTTEAYAQAKLELAATLVDEHPQALTSVREVRKDAVSGESVEGHPRLAAGSKFGPMSWPAALCLSLFSLGLMSWTYWQIGDPVSSEIAGAEVVLSLTDEAKDELDHWRSVLLARVNRHGDDAESWYLLGHVYLKQQAFSAAADAFEAAQKHHGAADIGIQLYWLQSRYLAARGELDVESRALADNILAQAPNHPVVLEILGVDAFRSGEFAQSVNWFNRAISGVRNPQQRANLLDGMQRARAALGDLNPSVDVAVSAAALPPASAVLFIIARPVGGGMPYAVVRRKATDLPLQVRLDDPVSMNPANPLSAAEEFEVVVRLSLTGAVAAAPGDWSWRSAALKVADLQKPYDIAAKLAPPAS